jgi:Asp-tRNA(Asn)/Glu-tRNA(Gln) amidotransferase A subunit family amidase
MNDRKLEMNRRRFVAAFTSMGLGSTLMPGALAAVAQDAPEVSVEMLEAAQEVAGLSFTRPQLEKVAERLNGERSPLSGLESMRQAGVGNGTPPALVFNPLPPGKVAPSGSSYVKRSAVSVTMPASDEELAFLPVTHLSLLIQSGQLKSTELTKLYLSRLKKYDPTLHCVVSLTEDLAMEQAKRADEEIAAGKYRGPLHGIPWGAKDLLAVRGTRTTWGASPYRDQVIDEDATVYRRLTDAGAVLVAKLTLGALASGDRWFGEQTRSPWNTERGSSGSSAGPGSATAAGLVGFSIGTETRGSIISPSTRNGVTGLRPTYGQVSRFGAMALSWSMDKIGPMCRSAEDCALVFDAIRGPDGNDNTLLDVPFAWDATRDITELRVGYLPSYLEEDIEDDPENPERVAEQRATQVNNRKALEDIRALGIEPVPLDLPDFPTDAIGFILMAEAAAAFDDLTRTRPEALDGMTEAPEESRWPDSFRSARFVPAVEYLRANQLRMRIMQELDEALGELDLFIGSDLGLTNLTGHPEVSVPGGFHNGEPTSLRFTGKLFGEAEILLLAHAYQSATDFHRRRPPI